MPETKPDENKNITYGELLTQAAKALEGAHVPDPETDARLLLMHAFDLDLTGYLLRRNEAVLKGEGDHAGRERLDLFRACIRKRCARIPLQHITGTAFFMGLPFRVNADVLIPRPDTEVLTETVLHMLEADHSLRRVLDLCTGSGCIAVSLKKMCPHCICTASDISARALEVAKENASLNGADVAFRRSDLFGQFSPDEVFDVIVSNPPYIASEEIPSLEPEVALHDPAAALDGGRDGLELYRRICEGAPAHLARGGWICFEIGAGQGRDVERLLEENGFSDIRIIRDLAGLDRVVCGALR